MREKPGLAGDAVPLRREGGEARNLRGDRAAVALPASSLLLLAACERGIDVPAPTAVWPASGDLKRKELLLLLLLMLLMLLLLLFRRRLRL